MSGHMAHVSCTMDPVVGKINRANLQTSHTVTPKTFLMKWIHQWALDLQIASVEQISTEKEMESSLRTRAWMARTSDITGLVVMLDRVRTAKLSFQDGGADSRGCSYFSDPCACNANAVTPLSARAHGCQLSCVPRNHSPTFHYKQKNIYCF